MADSLLVLGAYQETDIWIKRAKQLEFDIILVHPTFNNHHELYSTLSPYLTKFINCPFEDIDQIERICIENNVVGTLCIPCPNNVLIATANVNSRLNFRGIDLASADKCCNKLHFQKLLEDNQLPRPEYTLKFNANTNIKKEFPYIIKPTFGAGGIGVVKIKSSKQLEQFLNLPNRKFDDYLIQENIEAKYHVGFNCVVRDNKLLIISHNVRDISNESWSSFFKENIFPNDIPGFLSELNINYLESLIKAIGINQWPLKIEAFLDNNKEIISFIEINLRPGGTRSPLAFSQILGYDYALEQVKLVSPNHKSNFTEQSPPTKKYFMIKNFQFKPGKIKKIKWFDKRHEITSFLSSLKEGDIIPNYWDVTVAQKCGELIIIGNSKTELIKLAKTIESEIEIEYDNDHE